MTEIPAIRSDRSSSLPGPRSAARISLRSLLLAGFLAGGMARVCHAASLPEAPTIKVAPIDLGRPTLWIGLNSHGLPIDPVTAGLSFAEQMSHGFDVAFHPAIGPHNPFNPTGRLYTKVVSLMPIIIPHDGIDPRMLLPAPSFSGDEKMIVPAPLVEAANEIKAGESAK